MLTAMFRPQQISARGGGGGGWRRGEEGDEAEENSSTLKINLKIINIYIK